MKKIFLFIVLFLVSCTPLSKDTCDKCLNITFNDMIMMENNKETFVLILKSDECSVCQKYNYILDNYLVSNEIKIYSIDSKNLDLNNQEMKIFIEAVKEIAGVSDNSILPSTIFFLDGKIINVEIGILSEKELEDNIELLFSLD